MASISSLSAPQQARHRREGRVNASEEHLSSIKVEIATASNPSNPLQTVPLMAADYFEFPSMPRDSYVLKAVTTLDKRGYKITSDVVRVKLEGEGAFVTIPFSAVPRNSVEEVGPTSFWLLVVLVAGGLALVNRKELSDRLNTPPAGTAEKASDYINVPSQRKEKKQK
eukprot:CAMPEP_0206271354 /NCGR_PEP_ID=MMETSP0047_2-20121206/33385_1 /ASSEMBLY_ACC=CAM_ASM_000192 /TAXON_ID=195065 /ORGANISM="Chroomonas mesostigmatica_cf, Strain CCMP1168" /LENGTH=167 /DNA_ID=CAMNT_0053700113 /DNA_START=69 /DNA_END=573 /DNA_ORIENTATION=+